jgi:hypothetical protein
MHELLTKGEYDTPVFEFVVESLLGRFIKRWNLAVDKSIAGKYSSSCVG